MKKYFFICFITLLGCSAKEPDIKPSAAEQKTNENNLYSYKVEQLKRLAQEQAKEYADCGMDNVEKIDDGITSVKTISKALSDICFKESYQFKNYGTDEFVVIVLESRKIKKSITEYSDEYLYIKAIEYGHRIIATKQSSSHVSGFDEDILKIILQRIKKTDLGPNNLIKRVDQFITNSEQAELLKEYLNEILAMY